VKKICVFTGTRAEYGLLYWLLKELESSAELELKLIVSGTHLSHEFGFTLDDILDDGFKPSAEFPTLISSDSTVAISKSMALLSIDIASYLSIESPDLFIVLGDRFEILAAAQSALIARTPIAHIHGGEVTEGAIDEYIRHAVTKLSSIHFTSTNLYRKRVIQMGEHPSLVFNCGALGLESIKKYELFTSEQLSLKLGIDFETPYFLVAFHPETKKDDGNIDELIEALSFYPEFKKIIIYPNTDMMSRQIITAIKDFEKENSDSVSLIKSVDHRTYLSLLAQCSVLIGNSSSGIIEAPTLNVPVINIGERQTGRIRSSGIKNVDLDTESIVSAIKLAIEPDFRVEISRIENPYDSGDSSKIIVEKITEFLDRGALKKEFYNLEFHL